MFFIFFLHFRYGNIVSTKAILDKNTNKCTSGVLYNIIFFIGVTSKGSDYKDKWD